MQALRIPTTEEEWMGIAKEESPIDLCWGGAKGGGKDQSVDTELATPTGWTTMGDVRPGDYVLGEDGLPMLVVVATEVMKNPSYLLTFSDGSQVVAGEGHLWKTMTASDRANEMKRDPEWQQRRREKRKSRGTGKNPWLAVMNAKRKYSYLPSPIPSIRTTKDIHDSLYVKHGVVIANHSIANHRPLELPFVELPVPAYTMGAWLGDGSKSSSVVAGIDDGIFHNIACDGFVVRKTSDKYSRSVIGLVTAVRSAGVFGNKHIPVSYLRASRDQRLALLQGLMDTDGWCEKDGSCKIALARKELFDGVVELIRTLGITVNVTTGIKTATNGKSGNQTECWTVCFVTSLPVFRLERKLSRQNLAPNIRYTRRFVVKTEPVGLRETRCIQVAHPSGMYLCGHGMIPTHNSSLLCVENYIYACEVARHFALPVAEEVPHIAWMGRKIGAQFVSTTLDTWKQFIPSSCYILRQASAKHPTHILIDGRVALDYGGLDSRIDIERFNSAEYGMVSVDQAEETEQDDVAALRGSRRKRLKNFRTYRWEPLPYRGIFTANPRQGWLKDDFIDHPKPNHVFVAALHTDNPYLPASYVKTLESSFGHRPDLLRAYRDGQWDVLGAINQVILAEWIAAAKIRMAKPPYIKRLVSCDPARFGDDMCVILGLENTELIDATILPWCREPQIVNACEEMSHKLGDATIVVESVGLGEGVVDQLLLHGKNAIAYQPATASEKPESFYNLRAQVWFDVAKWFSLGVYDDKKMGMMTLPVPEDEALQVVHAAICRQLEWPWYEFRGQKTLLSAKEDIKSKHNGTSPDYADAYVQGIWHLPMIEVQVINERGATRRDKYRQDREVIHPMAY